MYKNITLLLNHVSLWKSSQVLTDDIKSVGSNNIIIRWVKGKVNRNERYPT